MGDHERIDQPSACNVLWMLGTRRAPWRNEGLAQAGLAAAGAVVEGAARTPTPGIPAAAEPGRPAPSHPHARRCRTDHEASTTQRFFQQLRMHFTGCYFLQAIGGPLCSCLLGPTLSLDTSTRNGLETRGVVTYSGDCTQVCLGLTIGERNRTTRWDNPCRAQTVRSLVCQAFSMSSSLQGPSAGL
jgi:hypothetical protein